jgi:hypothetical protein
MSSILAPHERTAASGRATASTQPPSERAWRAVGWFGLLLAFVGLADILLVWYPLGLGNPAWEFGAVDQTFSGLPLLTMGLAALLGSALALGVRWRIRVVAGVLLLLALALLSAYVLYLLNVPMALRMAPPEVAIGVKKAIVKTTIMAVAFPGAYLVASISALRAIRRGGTHE